MFSLRFTPVLKSLAATAVLAAGLAASTTAQAAPLERTGNFDWQPTEAGYAWKFWVWNGYRATAYMKRDNNGGAKDRFFEAGWQQYRNGSGVFPQVGVARYGKSVQTRKPAKFSYIRTSRTRSPLNANFTLWYTDKFRGKQSDGINESRNRGNIYFGIYGWMDDKSSPRWPFACEYYVIDYWQKGVPAPRYSRAEFERLLRSNRNSLKGNGIADYGWHTINGARYRVTRAVTPVGADQWISRRERRRKSGTVNVRAHFDKWRNLGMPDYKIVSLAWAAEGFGGSQGTVRYTRFTIPDLRP